MAHILEVGSLAYLLMSDYFQRCIFKVYFICEPGIELWPILEGAGGRIYSRLTTFDHTSPLAGGHMNKNPCDSLLGGTMLKFFAQRTVI